MTRRQFVSAGFGFCLLGGTALHAAQEGTETFPFAGLAVLPDDAVRTPARNQGDYDFKRANALDTELVQHVFLLRNEGTGPLLLMGLEPSCHCTSAALVPLPDTVPLPRDGSLPTLAPGEQIAVLMRVVLLGHPPGPFSKGVFVQAKGYAMPVARLQAIGTLEPVLTLDPTVVDFGPLRPGEKRTRRVTLTYDARLAPGGALPKLLSGSSNVHVGTVSPESISPVSPNARVRTYPVTVRATRATPVPTTLSFGPLPASAAKNSISLQKRTDTFKTGAVTVTYHNGH